jgi:asparagine synthase (glutamine-hydrolysing)
MCGIVGVFNYNTKAPVDRYNLKQASDLIMHRGPDGEGFYFDDNSGIGFGHRRLSIIDLSTGDQPMSNEDESIWIIFNGEIYNYLDIKSYLLLKGHKFKSSSDTEVIIHAYEEFGIDCLQKLNGIFAFAIWDSKKRKLFLARDHFGVKPLYFYDSGSSLIFASEMKSIIHLAEKKFNLNFNSLALCLTFRHSPAPSTLFEGIQKLPASYYLIKDFNNKYQAKSFWDYSIKINHNISEEYYVSLLTDKFSNAVKKQMMSDVPIGISLSGGVDSGSILSLMTKYSGSAVHAFSVGFEGMDPQLDEIHLAQINAQRFGAKFHHMIITENDYMNFIDKYIWHLEEPVGNQSAMAYYFVANMAKGTVKVLLNGQGADEPFAGYDKYVGMYYSLKFPLMIELLARFAYMSIKNLSRKTQLKRLIDYFSLKDDISKIASVSSLHSVDEVKKILSLYYFHDFSGQLLNDEVNAILYKNNEGTVVEKTMIYDMFSSLSENLLLSEDKMAMAASIEARVPFLDIDYINLALSIPSSLKIKNFSGKYIHKKMCEAFLPKEVIYKKKIGFDNPMDQWLRKSLGTELLDLINSSNSITKQYLNYDSVLNIYSNHFQLQDNQRFLYLLLCIEKWNKIFLEDK